MSDNIVKLFPDQPSAIELFEGDTNGSPKIEIETPISAKDIAIEASMQTLVTMCVNKLAGDLIDMGMDPEETPEEYCFIIESIISYVFRHHDKPHILQEMAHNTIQIEDEENMIFRFIEPTLKSVHTSEEVDDTR